MTEVLQVTIYAASHILEIGPGARLRFPYSFQRLGARACVACAKPSSGAAGDYI